MKNLKFFKNLNFENFGSFTYIKNDSLTFTLKNKNKNLNLNFSTTPFKKLTNKNWLEFHYGFN